MILRACQSGRYGTLVLFVTIAKEDRKDNADRGGFRAYPGKFIGECPLCWIGLRFETLLSLIALVLGLLELIRSGVTALRAATEGFRAF